MDAHDHVITKAEDLWVLWGSDQGVLDAVIQTEGASRSGVAALTLLLWDILTTMDDEVKLIWRSEWTLPKALYFFVRYYSLIALIVHNIHGVIPCVPSLIFELLSTTLVELAAEVIIILRVYAIYAAQRKIMRIMLIGFAIQIVLMAVGLGISMPHIMAGFYCKAADLPVEMVLYSTASIVYETFLFGLMMVGVIRGAKEGFADTTLLSVLVRDGAIAFLGIFFVMLLNTLLFTMAPTTLVTVGIPWVFAIVGAAGSRLVLNLRAKHATNLTGPSSLADLQFTIPSHMYSAVNLSEPDSVGLHECCDEEEGDIDREDAALNPSQTNSTNSSTGHNRQTRTSSDEESQSPPSPLSPQTPHSM